MSSSALVCATIATGSSGSGMSHGSTSSGSSLADSVSPVSARVSLATATMSPAIACDAGRCVLAQRRGQRADPLVDVVVLVAAVGHAVAGHVHRDVGSKRPAEDADEREPSDVGVGRRLDDLGDQRARRVARRAGLAGRPSGRGHGGQRVLQR